MGNAEPSSPRYATIDIKKVKANDSTPQYLDLVQRAIKGSGDGKVCVTSDDGNKATIRAHKTDYLGDVQVPSEALKYEPVSPVGSRFHLIVPVDKKASEATPQERVAAGLLPGQEIEDNHVIQTANRAEVWEKQPDGKAIVVMSKNFGPDEYDKAKKWAVQQAPQCLDRMTNSASTTPPIDSQENPQDDGKKESVNN